ncbi:hypothetical protein INR49_019199 [Caranx melampygus]|nr:hypothetical protein INR49_019199 [Caranx melampygus]
MSYTDEVTTQQLSKANFESPPISPKTSASAVKCKTPRQRAPKCNSSTLSHFFQKKSTTPAKETQRDGSVSQWVQRGTVDTADTHSADEADPHSAATRLPVTVKEEPMDLELSVKQEDVDSQTISPGPAPSSSPSADVKPVIKVECPVCSVSVSQQFINKHLDTCLSSGEKKDSLRRTRRPMTKLVYNLLSMNELKRRLKESHLSTQGSRDQLIKRHQEFVHIYNAQCDALNPRSAQDIAKEVEANEKIRGQLQGKAKPAMVFTKNQTEKEIDEMHSNYRKQHSGAFSRLLAQVKGRLETTRQTRIKQEVSVEGGDVDRTPSADQVAEPKSCSVVTIEDGDSDEEPLTRRMKLSSSPTYSDLDF